MTKTEKQLLPKVAMMECILGIIPEAGASITERVKNLSAINDLNKKLNPTNSRRENIKFIIGVTIWLLMGILFFSL